MRAATRSSDALTAALETTTPRAIAVQAAVQVGAVCGFAALTAVSAHVRIPLPFSPVPITLQTLTVLLAGIVLGSGRGALSQVLYVGLGLAGLPVFAGGAGALLGPTGGYLVGFVLAAALAGAVARRRRDTVGVVGAFALGSLALFSCGVVWLSAVTQQPLGHAIAVGVLPFAPGEALKLAAAVGLCRALTPRACAR